MEDGELEVLDSMAKEVHHTLVEVGRKPFKVEGRELQRQVTTVPPHKAVLELQEASEAEVLALVMVAVAEVDTPVVAKPVAVVAPIMMEATKAIPVEATTDMAT